MNIAILGSGNGGCAVTFDCAAAGHQVSMFDFERFPANIAAIRNRGGIACKGELEGFQSSRVMPDIRLKKPWMRLQ
jgi:opine dehydrogenase